ncbi:hypothetical protein MMC11_008268 [Xylographa trunciseda]|nr:hypothetical protein [Xylographa trunciseda]
MAQAPSEMPLPTHLDGTTLEGGGQLLRLALSISSLTHVPIHVSDIRGKRGPKSTPGKDGGLKSAHLAGAEWLARATDAATTGMAIKSRDLVFRPTSIENTLPTIIGTAQDQGKLKNGGTETQIGVWKNIYAAGRLVRRSSHIPMSSPGSIFLIMQAILPYVLFSSTSGGDLMTTNEPIPIRLTIHGGTNVFHSLSYEYASQVLFPMLHSKLGIGPIDMTLQSRGWSTGRADVGSVVFDIIPLGPGRNIPAFSYTNRGYVSKFHVSTLADTLTARAYIRESVTVQLLKRYPDAEILFPVDEDSKHSKRLYLLIVAETSNGYRLGRDWLYDEKIGVTRLDKTLHRLVSKVVKDIHDELAHGGCVDEYMQDQLVVFQALTDGRTEVDGGSGRVASLHTQTARWVIETLLGPRFEDGHCHGIGLHAGEAPRKNASNLAESEDFAGKLSDLSLKTTIK